jgi:hypothetical protein
VAWNQCEECVPFAACLSPGLCALSIFSNEKKKGVVLHIRSARRNTIPGRLPLRERLKQVGKIKSNGEQKKKKKKKKKVFLFELMIFENPHTPGAVLAPRLHNPSTATCTHAQHVFECNAVQTVIE